MPRINEVMNLVKILLDLEGFELVCDPLPLVLLDQIFSETVYEVFEKIRGLVLAENIFDPFLRDVI